MAPGSVRLESGFSVWVSLSVFESFDGDAINEASIVCVGYICRTFVLGEVVDIMCLTDDASGSAISRVVEDPQSCIIIDPTKKDNVGNFRNLR